MHEIFPRLHCIKGHPNNYSNCLHRFHSSSGVITDLYFLDTVKLWNSLPYDVVLQFIEYFSENNIEINKNVVLLSFIVTKSKLTRYVFVWLPTLQLQPNLTKTKFYITLCLQIQIFCVVD